MSYIKHRADESLEDYLETILILQKRTGNVRSIDIAHEMNFSKPSVSVAMKNLREKQYITVSDDGYITLTESGKSRASDVLERHTLLSSFLVSIGVDSKTAMEDACRVEHDLSEESYQAIKNYYLHSVKKQEENDENTVL